MSDTNYPRSLVDQNFGLCISPDDLIFPFYYQSGGNYCRPWKWFYQSGTKDTGSTIDENEDIFKISLDVQHFKPNEINVKVSDSEVIIQGNHKEKQDSHGFISRQFTRRYILPYNCLSDTVDCTLSSDGILIITAKKALKIKQTKEISVPIQYHSDQLKSDQKDIKENAACEEKTHSERAGSSQRENESKKGMQIMLKEEHCRLLKPEFLGPAILESNQKVNTDVALNLSVEKRDGESMSANISTEMRSQETEEKTSQNYMIQQSMKVSNQEAQEIVMKDEYVSMEKQITEKASDITEEIKLQDTLRSDAREIISQNNPLTQSTITEKMEEMEEQISQKASIIIEETISESSSNITTSEKSSQNALKEKGTTSESQISQQKLDFETQEVYYRAEDDKKEEQVLQKSLETIDELTSSSNTVYTAGEIMIKDSMSSESEIRSVQEKIERTMTSEATKIEECKEEFKATPTMCTSMQANVQAMSSKSAAHDSFEEISVASTEISEVKVDEGLRMDEVFKNSNTSCGMSGMNATIEEIIEKCNAEMADIANKIAESHVISSEKANLSMSFKSSETQESSLEETFSSVSSKIKDTSEHKSLLMHDVIAELKDASENI